MDGDLDVHNLQTSVSPCERELAAWTAHGSQAPMEAEVRWVGQGVLLYLCQPPST